MHRCNRYHEVLGQSTFIRRYCDRRKLSIRNKTTTNVRLFWCSADDQPLLRQQLQQCSKSKLSDVRYSHSDTSMMRQSSLCHNRIAWKIRGAGRSAMILPHHQPSQPYRSMSSIFEDHYDAMKSLYELPKLVSDEDVVHSFLTIDFEDEFIDTLHGIVCDFKVQFEKACRPLPRVRNNHEWGQVIPLDIQIYPKESLRSIILFNYYDTLFNLTPPKLCKYHYDLTRRLKNCGFLSTPGNDMAEPNDSNNKNTIGRTETNSSVEKAVDIEPTTTILPPGSPTPHWYIRVKELKLVPRIEKNKLIVVFQPSPFWKHLHKQVQNLANRTRGLHRTMTVDECDHKWEPYIPIAHVYNGMGGRTKYEKMLQELLPVMPFDQYNVSSKIQTISMSGTIPVLPPTPTSATLHDLFRHQAIEQPHHAAPPQPTTKELNWNFHFHGRPLLQIKERTDIQDSLPENFTHDDGDDVVDDDDITDAEVIPDPLETYFSSLDLIDLPYEKKYPNVDRWNQIAKTNNSNDDEEIDTDDVIINPGPNSSRFKVPDDLNINKKKI